VYSTHGDIDGDYFGLVSFSNQVSRHRRMVVNAITIQKRFFFVQPSELEKRKTDYLKAIISVRVATGWVDGIVG
jgi:hypothetical protein